MNIGNILKDRIEAYQKNPQQAVKRLGTEYQKQYNFAVKCFQERINKDRKKAGYKEVPFMAVKIKLAALKEISDMRWFYRECTRYAGTRNKKTKEMNTFAGGFYGALKVK